MFSSDFKHSINLDSKQVVLRVYFFQVEASVSAAHQHEAPGLNRKLSNISREVILYLLLMSSL